MLRPRKPQVGEITNKSWLYGKGNDSQDFVDEGQERNKETRTIATRELLGRRLKNNENKNKNLTMNGGREWQNERNATPGPRTKEG